MKGSIQFGSKEIDFHLAFSNRKSLGITVTPEMEVLVKAPIETPLQKVKECLQKKAAWIIKQQSFFLTFQPKTPARKFVSGETHLYLGRQYLLRIMNDESGITNDSVKLSGRFLNVYTNDKTKAKTLVENWYLEKAKERLPKIAKPLMENFGKRHSLTFITHHSSFLIHHLSLRAMPLRWGSCTSKGKIILNPELIKAPKGCIEYVIVHELCHLIHYDHTQKFIDLQTKEMKEWEKWKMKLEKLLA
ncbi:SprT family zinc-dependent metalloprotease [Fluviicola sp.]|jgi:predicted metal-dependent hydrolase|uniref:M48 family metallopeptidase n=1 Tax=Fluviicola sp. TaxID=1917219 RepID=UPI002825BFA5|nr:SprT family zinc-dependent metalloprotease [Fluviicola sp.]MDR0802756.1 M48 family metallopeptidase [Fluviicola sp.]